MPLTAGSILIPDYDNAGVGNAIEISPVNGTTIAVWPSLGKSQHRRAGSSFLPKGIFATPVGPGTSATSVKIYDRSPAELFDVLSGSWLATGPIGTDFNDTFYVVRGAVVSSVSSAGVVGGVTWTPTLAASSTIKGLSVNAARTILTYGDRLGGIKQWDLVNDVALPTLVTLAAGTSFDQLLVLPDGKILVIFKGTAGTNDLARVYSAAGALLGSFDTGVLAAGGSDSSLAIDPRDASAFFLNISDPPAGDDNRFRKIRVSDMGVLAEFTVNYFNGAPPFFLIVPAGDGVPNPPPPVAPVPCEPESTITNGGKGKSGCNDGGDGFDRVYYGPFGDVPIHANPADGESLAHKERAGLEAWIELRHVDYPSGDVTIYRRAFEELGNPAAYEGGRKQAGLLEVGEIEHGIGNEQGSFEAATIDLGFTDTLDRLFRNLADDQDVDGDEITIKIASDAAQEGFA